jgi:hypothetical protein
MNKQIIRTVAFIVMHFYCAAIMASSFDLATAPKDTTSKQNEFTYQTLAAAANRGIDLRPKQDPATVTNAARHALVIGNSHYPSSPLRNPQNDATDIAQSLKKLGFQVTLLIDGKKQGMVSAVRNFTQVLKEQRGVGLFYYAGHGMQISGRNYLIPVDADIAQEHDIKYEALDVGRVLDGMEEAGNNANILILDACRNNPYARSFRSSSQGLAQIDSPTGTLLSYSTAPGRVAKDGEGRNGIYTQHLLQEMMTPGASIETTFKRVRAGVMAQTNNEQTPWESSSLTAEFYFNGGDGTMKSEYPPPAAIAYSSYEGEEEQPYTRPAFKVKEPWYERWYVWVTAGILVIIGAVAISKGGGDGGDGGGSGGGAGGNGG